MRRLHLHLPQHRPRSPGRTRWAHIALALAAVAVTPNASAWSPAGINAERPYAGYVGPDACRECHAELVETQSATAHFLASAPADSQTVMGPFVAGRDRLATRDPAKELVMQQDGQTLRQALVLRAPDRDVVLRSGDFDIVLGPVKGQTYLYWRYDVLCQLPASYIKDGDTWAYSPGYPEGVPYFDRVIKPDCMECHATVFENVLPDRIVKTDKAILGVTCEACHGPGENHVRARRADPQGSETPPMTHIAGLSRDQQVEACGYCHSGIKPDSRKRPAFSFRPGDRLADFFELEANDTGATPEVHGNQMGLLQQSRCYRESADLTCTSCHDPHRRQRGQLLQFAERCLGCHQDLDRHPQVAADTDLRSGCVDCHMPLVNSQLIDVTEGGHRHNFAVRNHRIGIYRD